MEPEPQRPTVLDARTRNWKARLSALAIFVGAILLTMWMLA